MADYEVGYCKPPIATRFGAGNNANPNGKTSAHRKAEIQAAELAAIVRLELVKAVADAIDGASTEEKQMQIRHDVLNLLKQSEDRGFGSPKQTIEQEVTTRDAPKGLDEFYAKQGQGQGLQVDSEGG